MKWVFLSCLFLGGMLITCDDHRAWTTQDSWYTGPPPGDPLYWSWSQLDRARIYMVIESKQPDAERLLQDVPVVGLTDQQAGEFIGKALPQVPGTKPYLTRGVSLNPSGGFSVYMRDGQLVVHHGSLGRSARPMKRQALVLQLEQAPSQVFITCAMAE